MNTHATPTRSASPASAKDEPKPSSGEDSVPQEDGTDNEWQMEPFKQDQPPAKD